MAESCHNIVVCVVGLSNNRKEPYATRPGVGKSCLCFRFAYPGYDGYVDCHPSVLALHEFESPVINNNHFLYWGSPTRSPSGRQFASVQFHVLEQTVFYQDVTSHPFNSLTKPDSVDHYIKRITGPIESPGKQSYYSRDEMDYSDCYTKLQYPQHLSKCVRGFVICFDVSLSDEELDMQCKRVTPILEYLSKHKRKSVIAVTKRDCYKIPALEKAYEIRKKFRTHLVETSAHDDLNVDEVFLVLARSMIKEFKGPDKVTQYDEAAERSLLRKAAAKRLFLSYVKKKIGNSDERLTSIQYSEEFKKCAKFHGSLETGRIFAQNALELYNLKIESYPGVKENPDMRLEFLEEFVDGRSDLYSYKTELKMWIDTYLEQLTQDDDSPTGSSTDLSKPAQEPYHIFESKSKIAQEVMAQENITQEPAQECTKVTTEEKDLAETTLPLADTTPKLPERDDDDDDVNSYYSDSGGSVSDHEYQNFDPKNLPCLSRGLLENSKHTSTIAPLPPISSEISESAGAAKDSRHDVQSSEPDQSSDQEYENLEFAKRHSVSLVPKRSGNEASRKSSEGKTNKVDQETASEMGDQRSGRDDQGSGIKAAPQPFMKQLANTLSGSVPPVSPKPPKRGSGSAQISPAPAAPPTASGPLDSPQIRSPTTPKGKVPPPPMRHSSLSDEAMKSHDLGVREHLKEPPPGKRKATIKERALKLAQVIQGEAPEEEEESTLTEEQTESDTNSVEKSAPPPPPPPTCKKPQRSSLELQQTENVSTEQVEAGPQDKQRTKSLSSSATMVIGVHSLSLDSGTTTTPPAVVAAGAGDSGTHRPMLSQIKKKIAEKRGKVEPTMTSVNPRDVQTQGEVEVSPRHTSNLANIKRKLIGEKLQGSSESEPSPPATVPRPQRIRSHDGSLETLHDEVQTTKGLLPQSTTPSASPSLLPKPPAIPSLPPKPTKTAVATTSLKEPPRMEGGTHDNDGDSPPPPIPARTEAMLEQLPAPSPALIRSNNYLNVVLDNSAERSSEEKDGATQEEVVSGVKKRKRERKKTYPLVKLKRKSQIKDQVDITTDKKKKNVIVSLRKGSSKDEKGSSKDEREVSPKKTISGSPKRKKETSPEVQKPTEQRGIPKPRFMNMSIRPLPATPAQSTNDKKTSLDHTEDDYEDFSFDDFNVEYQNYPQLPLSAVSISKSDRLTQSLQVSSSETSVRRWKSIGPQDGRRNVNVGRPMLPLPDVPQEIPDYIDGYVNTNKELGPIRRQHGNQRPLPTRKLSDDPANYDYDYPDLRGAFFRTLPGRGVGRVGRRTTTPLVNQSETAALMRTVSNASSDYVPMAPGVMDDNYINWETTTHREPLVPPRDKPRPESEEQLSEDEMAKVYMNLPSPERLIPHPPRQRSLPQENLIPEAPPPVAAKPTKSSDKVPPTKSPKPRNKPRSATVAEVSKTMKLDPEQAWTSPPPHPKASSLSPDPEYENYDVTQSLPLVSALHSGRLGERSKSEDSSSITLPPRGIPRLN